MDVISIWYALIYVEKAFQQKYGLLCVKKKYVSQNQMRKLGSRWGGKELFLCSVILSLYPKSFILNVKKSSETELKNPIHYPATPTFLSTRKKSQIEIDDKQTKSLTQTYNNLRFVFPPFSNPYGGSTHLQIVRRNSTFFPSNGHYVPIVINSPSWATMILICPSWQLLPSLRQTSNWMWPSSQTNKLPQWHVETTFPVFPVAATLSTSATAVIIKRPSVARRRSPRAPSSLPAQSVQNVTWPGPKNTE